ncbi:MAG: hypothetical protein J5625_04165 [Lachnospiraceae bacterium]|nr:hypothetical protein [Lachnospiraceae bacterium]
MKNKWENARYLIDAKKCIDRLLFISDNIEKLQNIGLRNKINETQRDFYLNCCIVLDEQLPPKTNKKKELCERDEIINRIYYERDKNTAHKDNQYCRREYSSLDEMIEDMKKELLHVKDICSNCIPDAETLDFVSHDKELFRFVHHITPEVEEKILEKKHPFRIKSLNDENAKIYSVLNDIEDYKYIPEEKRKEYIVVISNGICFFEGIQERQDACIKMNYIYDENIWCEFDYKEFEKIKELTRLGAFDEYGIIQELPKDPIIQKRIFNILNNP